jgi:excisionase family DNA binding protein
MLATEEQYLTIPEVAERFRVTRKTVYRWIETGELHGIRFKRAYRIAESDLQDFIERHRVRPRPDRGKR